MRRWNGWGEETTTYPLPDSAAHYLTTLVGEGLSLPDVSFTETVATVPPPRLPAPRHQSGQAGVSAREARAALALALKIERVMRRH